jgi:hypothetical protein
VKCHRRQKAIKQKQERGKETRARIIAKKEEEKEEER